MLSTYKTVCLWAMPRLWVEASSGATLDCPGSSTGKRILLQYRRPWFGSWIRKIHWRKEQLPTPVSWPGEVHGLYSPWGHRVGHDWATFTFTTSLEQSLRAIWGAVSWAAVIILPQIKLNLQLTLCNFLFDTVFLCFHMCSDGYILKHNYVKLGKID